MRTFPFLPFGPVERLLVVLALLLGLPRVVHAHNGEDHDHGAAAPTPAGARYFTTSAASEKFELVLRYEPLHGGEAARLRLFVADFVTNVPIKGAKLTVTAVEDPKARFTATEQAPGDYQLTGQFAQDRTYGLAAQVVGPDGRADLLLLPGIAVGQELPAPPTASAATPWLNWKMLLLLAGVFLAGVAVTALLLRRRQSTPPSHPVTP